MADPHERGFARGIGRIGRGQFIAITTFTKVRPH